MDAAEKIPFEVESSVGGVKVRTALYRHFDADGVLLYVGISLRPIKRLSQHCDAAPWFGQISSVTVTWFDSRELAINAEISAIKAEHPAFNVVHRVKKDERFAVLERMAADSNAELTRHVARYKLTYTAQEAAAEIGVRSSFILRAMDAGELPFFECGKKRITTGWSLIAYIEALELGHTKLRAA